METLSFWDKRPSVEIWKIREQSDARDLSRKSTTIWEQDELFLEVVTMIKVFLSAYLEFVGISTDEWISSLVEEVFPSNEKKAYGFGLVIAYTVLLLVPNLRSLALTPELSESFFPDLADMGHFFRRVFRPSTKPESSTMPYMPLAKLRTLQPYHTEFDQDWVFLQQLIPFMELPGLEVIYSTSGVCDLETAGSLREDEDIFWEEYPSFMGPPVGEPQLHPRYLRRIEITFGCFDPEGILVFLRDCVQLEVFRFFETLKHEAVGDNWDVGGCVQNIGMCVGDTLKELALHIFYSLNSRTGITTCFRAFRVLETLEIDMELFSDDDTMVPVTHTLASLLPVSIRNVTLYLKPENNIPDALQLLTGMNDPRLVNIEEVVLRNHLNSVFLYRDHPEKADYKDLKSLAQSVGVKWVDDERDPYDLWGGWVEEFTRRFKRIQIEDWFDYKYEESRR